MLRRRLESWLRSWEMRRLAPGARVMRDGPDGEPRTGIFSRMEGRMAVVNFDGVHEYVELDDLILVREGKAH